MCHVSWLEFCSRFYVPVWKGITGNNSLVLVEEWLLLLFSFSPNRCLWPPLTCHYYRLSYHITCSGTLTLAWPCGFLVIVWSTGLRPWWPAAEPSPTSATRWEYRSRRPLKVLERGQAREFLYQSSIRGCNGVGRLVAQRIDNLPASNHL